MWSGSKVRRRQFTAMKAIWPPAKTPGTLEMELDDFCLDTVWGQARGLLESSDDFRRFLTIVHRGLDISDLSAGYPGWAGSWMPTVRWLKSCVDPIGMTSPAV